MRLARPLTRRPMGRSHRRTPQKAYGRLGIEVLEDRRLLAGNEPPSASLVNPSDGSTIPAHVLNGLDSITLALDDSLAAQAQAGQLQVSFSGNAAANVQVTGGSSNVVDPRDNLDIPFTGSFSLGEIKVFVRPGAGANQLLAGSFTAASDIIIDASPAEASIIGDWRTLSDVADQVGGTYIHDRDRGQGKSVTFRPTLHPGTYEVAVKWVADDNRAEKVPYEIVHRDGVKRGTLNQKRETRENVWQSLGDFFFSPDVGRVTISNHGTDVKKLVVLDAVRFRFISSDAPSQSPGQRGDVTARLADPPDGSTISPLLINQRNHLKITFDEPQVSGGAGPMVNEDFVNSIEVCLWGTSVGTERVSCQDAPVARDDTNSTGKSGTLFTDVLANDTGQGLTIESAEISSVTLSDDNNTAVPAGSAAVEVMDKMIAFRPGDLLDPLSMGATADVLVRYAVKDSQGATAIGKLTITVMGADDMPVARPDTNATSNDMEVMTDVLANDTVDVGEEHSIDVGTTSINGSEVNLDEDAIMVVEGLIKFDPKSVKGLANAANSMVEINYTVSDAQDAQSSSTLTITVTSPGIVADIPTTATAGDPVDIVAALVGQPEIESTRLANDWPVDVEQGLILSGDTITFGPNGEFDFLAENQTAKVVVSYQVDVSGTPLDAERIVTVMGVNNAPIAVNDEIVTRKDKPVDADVLANDSDVDLGDQLILQPGSVSIVRITANSNGSPIQKNSATATIVDGKFIRFDPMSDFSSLGSGETATVEIKYRVTDRDAGSDDGETAQGTLHVTVINPVIATAPAGQLSAASDDKTIRFQLPGARPLRVGDVNVVIKKTKDSAAEFDEQTGSFSVESVTEVDNADTDRVFIVGDWVSGNNTRALKGEFIHDGDSKDSKSVSYFPQLADGFYQVDLRWTAGANRAKSVPVEITSFDFQTSATVTTRKSVNQRRNDGNWVPLGVFAFRPNVGQVTLRTDGADGFVVADGVRFSFLDSPPNPRLPGDVNSDGLFDRTDIVALLQTGRYLTGQPAEFEQGDWNGDGVFDQLDLTLALQLNHYSP